MMTEQELIETGAFELEFNNNGKRQYLHKTNEIRVRFENGLFDFVRIGNYQFQHVNTIDKLKQFYSLIYNEEL